MKHTSTNPKISKSGWILISFFLLIPISNQVYAQAGCDGTVPTYVVDLTGQPNGTYISPPDNRVGNCCGTSAPDKCIQFIVTLDPMSNGVIFSIASGAVPPGAIFYQVNCGPPTPVGSTLCLTGVGPHYLTFCKPGNNTNTYQITSLAQPQSGPDANTTVGCSAPLYVNGLDAPSTTWTSIAPGPTGTYNSYLSCTSGCDSVQVTPGTGAPAFVDYLVCGYVFGGCFPFTYCDTIRVNINQDLSSINTNVACFGQATGSVDLTVPGTGPVAYSWSNGATTQDISGLAAGSYSVTVTNTNGCTRTLTANITQPAALGIIGTANPVTCFGGSNGSIDITPSGGTGGYTYSWTNGATTQDISGLTAGGYTVTITDANGCTQTFSSTITQPVAALSVIGTPTNILCFGGNTGAIDITPSGGTPGYTYTWTNGATSQDLSSLTAGGYTVTVTDANGCTNNSFSANITQPAAALSVNGTSTNILCFGGNTGAIDITPSGGTPGYTYTWTNGATSQDLSSLTAGGYTVTVTDANGCTNNSFSANITQPVAALSVNGTSTNILCFGGNTGAIDITPSGGTPGYTYTWTNGATSQDLSSLTAGAYTVTVTDANGCTNNSFSANITQPAAALSVNGTPTNILCFGGNTGAIDITPSGGTPGYTYAWSNGATSQDLSSLTAGGYTVTVTDANGCTNNSFSANITQPASALSVNGTPTNILCFGGNTGAIDITPSGGTPGYTYTWTNGATSQDLSGLTAGGYTVTVTDANGCTNNSFSANITQPATALSVNGTPTNILCFGGNTGAIDITPSGGTPGYTYTWTNGATSQDLSGLTAGGYTVTVTDANGCTNNSYSATLTQPAAALSVIGTPTNILCFGGNTGAIDITPSGGTPGYTYTWTNGATSQDLSSLTAGGYTVTVTDANGCTNNSFSANITQPAAALSVNGTPTNILCFGGNTGVIDITPSGGTPGYTYAWSNGATSQDLSGLAVGGYTVTVTDANGCTNNSFSANITQPAAALSVNGTPTNILCFGGNTGAIDITPSGGTPGYTYSWSNGSTTQDLSGLAAGGYTVTVTDANGCTNNSYSATLTQPASAISVTGIVTNVLCTGGTGGGIDITPSGGTPAYSYIWSNGSTNQDLTGVGAGSYTVTITDANGCTNNAFSANVSQPLSALIVNGTPLNPSCTGYSDGAVNITPSGGTIPYEYNWSNGSGTQDISGLPDGTYTVIVTDANGCSVTGDWSLLDPEAVNVLSTVQPILCYGVNNAGISLEIIGGTPGYNVLWNTGATTTTLSNLGPGNYSVTVTDSRGCSNSSSYTLTAPAPVSVSLNSPYTIWLGDNVDLEAFPSGGTGAYTYSWNPPTDLSCTDCAITEAAPKLNTTYAVIVTDENGCTATADTYIEVMYALYVPNTFTPNGDNDNDEFLAVSVSVKEFSMRVFDRWGEEIFSTININEGWDGNYKGIESKQDVYVYRIEATFLNGKSQELVGQVNLLR